MPELADRILEALRADQIERWHRGERRLVESYLDANPELRTDADALLDLIYSEVVVRDELGETPEAEEYLRRFPHLEAALRRQFAVHRLLESPSLRSTPRNGSIPSTIAATPSYASTMQTSFSDSPSVPGYEILGELGRGGMGIVYKARQTNLNRIVALKLIRTPCEDISARFRTEAETAARLQHPNIVQIYECGASAAGPYVALEYVDGDSLARKIDGTPLPPRDAAALLLPLARAMHYAHGQGVIHRDLKPANVLLSSEFGVRSSELQTAAAVEANLPRPIPSDLKLRTPKIADFGLAKSIDSDSGQTKSGAILGTPSYMAPEQASGHSREVGPAADVYALGAILYEMLTGRPPFKAATAMETMQQVVAEEPVPPRRLQSAAPRDLETICLKCLRKEPHKRYASAEGLAADLERYLHGEPIQARPVSAWERALKWSRRRPAVAALMFLTVAATTTALLAWASFTRRLDTEKTEARKQENRAVLQEAETRRQRDEALRLLEIGLAAVRDHAEIVVKGKEARGRNPKAVKNPAEVLFQLACAYARSSDAFRKDASLAPDHAQKLSTEYADSAWKLLLAASHLKYFDIGENCRKLSQKELKSLSERFDFDQLRLPLGRGVSTNP